MKLNGCKHGFCAVFDTKAGISQRESSEDVSMKKLMSVLPVVIAPLLAWLFPVMFMYARNAKEVAAAEMLLPAGIFIVCAAAALLIGALIFRDWNTAAFFSVGSGLVLTNYDLLLYLAQKVIPQMSYWQLLCLVAVIGILLCIVIKRLKLADDVVRVAGLVFGGLILLNLITAIPTIIQRVSDSRKQPAQILDDGAYQPGKRNIYYLLCDEYASFAQLEEEFGFDNGDFRAQVEELGFNISETSENDSDATVVVIANLMQLDYVADADSTSVELDNLTKNGRLQQLLIENGYRLRGVGDTAWLNIQGARDEKPEAVTSDGVSFSDLLLLRSFLKPFLSRFYAEDGDYIAAALDDLSGLEIEPNTSTFTFAYVCYPHHPYFFNEYGEMNPSEKWINDETGTNNDAYVGAVKYVNSRILPAVKRIIEQDPDAIVVLCSDHGNRFGAISGKYTHRILNLLYYGGEIIPEFEGLSAINTARLILNREFGLEMAYVELPAQTAG